MFNFDLLENEKLIEIHRQTEWALAKTVLIVFVLIYLPWYFLIKYELVTDYRRLLIAWTVLVFLYAVYKYFLWLLNVYILTDKRLVAVHYASLVRKKVLESPLDTIVNISFATTGVVSSLLNFGDVQVQVANLADPLVLKNVSNPAKIKDNLWKNQKPSQKKAVLQGQTIVVPGSGQAQKRKMV